MRGRARRDEGREGAGKEGGRNVETTGEREETTGGREGGKGERGRREEREREEGGRKRRERKEGAPNLAAAAAAGELGASFSIVACPVSGKASAS